MREDWRNLSTCALFSVRNQRWKSAMAEARDHSVADDLDDLYQDHENRDGDEHHRGVETLVTITHGEIAQAATADHASHSGIAYQRDGGNNNSGENARQGFRKQRPEHSLPGRGPHRATRFEYTAVD